MSNIFIKPAYFVVLTKNAPFLQLNSYFFHTMDLNGFKKNVTCFPAWISGEMCLRPELFLDICFFQCLFFF